MFCIVYSNASHSFMLFTNSGPITPPDYPLDSLILRAGSSPNGAGSHSIGENSSIVVSLYYIAKEDTETQVESSSTSEGTPEALPVDEETVWTLEVYQASTNQKVSSLPVKGATCYVDTSAFAPGVYIFRAIIGEQTRYLKIQL
jgi:hypothetical protein